VRRLVAIAVVLAAGASAFVLSGAAGGPSAYNKSYKIVLDNAFGLTEGGDLKIGGVKAGTTPKMEVTSTYPHRALVTAQVTAKGFGSFRSDATCSVRQQSLIGEYYVDCQPGRAREELPDGGTIPVSQTTSTVPVDLVNNVMRRPYRERFRLILAELGTGLAGRPQDIQETLKRAHPGFRETSKTFKILGQQRKIIRDFVEDSDTVVKELARNRKDVVRWVREAGDTAAISASRRAELRGNFQRLPTFLAELQPTMVRLGELADEQVPLLIDLRQAAPDLDRFFEELGPFAEASRPSFRSLGEMGVVGRRALRKGRDEIRELRRVAVNAPGTAKPLRQFLQTLDDRELSRDNDPRAAETAPPAPDKNAFKGGQGYTGMEALLNYFFWQTLSINAFDEISHFLRVAFIEDPRNCSPYQANPSIQLQRDCGAYTGPTQPGLQGNVADFTEGRDGINASSRNSRRELPREAQAKPGEPDPSKPQIALPPELLEALRGLTRPGQKSSPERAPIPPGSEAQLLDYLLAP
jgi:ABC-type transporter Mla subunit MlaD